MGALEYGERKPGAFQLFDSVEAFGMCCGLWGGHGSGKVPPDSSATWNLSPPPPPRISRQISCKLRELVTANPDHPRGDKRLGLVGRN